MPQPAKEAAAHAGPPRIGASLKHSLRLLRSRSAAAITLGAGIVLSLLSVCFGVGVIMTPWLLCELLALLLGEALAAPPRRSRSWVFACAILLGAVLLTSSVGWLTWLALGTDAPAIDGEAPIGLAHAVSPGGLFAVASALASLAFVLPFIYAPLILIEGRARLGGAVLESAQLVANGGALGHFVFSLAANALQAAPIWIAALLASILSEADSTGLWALLSVPLLALSVPLGQGMIVSAYAERRAEVAELRRTRNASKPSVGLAIAWTAIVAAPLLSFSLLGASFVRPSRLPEGHLPEGAEPVATFARLARVERVQPSGTALEIEASPRGVRVVASDGGGVGTLPLRSDAPVEAARVVRRRDDYGIELLQAGRAYVTWIDRSGVRLDDDLRDRLLDRVPSWALLLMLFSLLSTAAALLPVLAMLGELRRKYAADPAERAPPRELSGRRASILTRAWVLAAALAPLAGFSLYWGARSLFG